MRQVKKVVMLPTQKASKLYRNHLKQLNHVLNGDTVFLGTQSSFQHLYIFSNDDDDDDDDDDTKSGDWYISNGTLYQSGSNTYQNKLPKWFGGKVIASTDKSVTPEAWIPDSFLPVYVKAHNEGKPITEVSVDIIDNGNEEWWGSDTDGEPIWVEKMQPKTRKDGSIVLNQAMTFSRMEMFENMQYYMEYCRSNEYVTPMEWIEKHKHF